MIELRDVTHRYPGFGAALESIDLRIDAGELALLAGPSGAGKSTLLKLLYAAEQPQRGEVLINGRAVHRLHPDSVPYLRRNLGVIFQDFKLLPRRTVYDNVALALEVTGTPAAEIRRRVPEVLGRVGLREHARRLPGTLSGGEQQRAAIARAVVNRPTIVLADEPTGNLDPERAAEILDLLVELGSEAATTVVVATHDPTVLARFPDRVIELRDGRIAADRRVARAVDPEPARAVDPEPERAVDPEPERAG